MIKTNRTEEVGKILTGPPFCWSFEPIKVPWNIQIKCLQPILVERILFMNTLLLGSSELENVKNGACRLSISSQLAILFICDFMAKRNSLAWSFKMINQKPGTKQTWMRVWPQLHDFVRDAVKVQILAICLGRLGKDRRWWNRNRFRERRCWCGSRRGSRTL